MVTPQVLAAERRQREALAIMAPRPALPPTRSSAAGCGRAVGTNVSADRPARGRRDLSPSGDRERTGLGFSRRGSRRRRQQAPPADSEVPANGGDAGTVWSCASADCRAQGSAAESQQPTPSSVLLRRIWDVWEAQQQEDEREAAVSARAVTRLLAEGQHAQRREALEYEHVLLASTTRLHANRSCWRNCRADGACEWCGTNLCCMASSKATGVCRGKGGPRSHKCTEVRNDAPSSSPAAATTTVVRPWSAARRAEAPAHGKQRLPRGRVPAHRPWSSSGSANGQARPSATPRGWWRASGGSAARGRPRAEGAEAAVNARSWQGELLLSFALEEERRLANLLLGLRRRRGALAGGDGAAALYGAFAAPGASRAVSLHGSTPAAPRGRLAWRRRAYTTCSADWHQRGWRDGQQLRVLLVEPDVVVRASPTAAAGGCCARRAPQADSAASPLPSSERRPTCDDADLGAIYVGGADGVYRDALHGCWPTRCIVELHMLRLGQGNCWP